MPDAARTSPRALPAAGSAARAIPYDLSNGPAAPSTRKRHSTAVGRPSAHIMRARIGDGNGEVHMNRARAIDAFVAWTLSVLLSGVFLLAGIPKLLGIPTVAIEAAAMTGFPTWIRVLAGLFEVAGAIFLLIPSLATAGAIGLACLMIPATFTQVASGESGVYVPLV